MLLFVRSLTDAFELKMTSMSRAYTRAFLICISFLSFLIQAKLETKALKAKRPGFTDERYNETSYYYDANTSMYYSQSNSR